MNMDEIHMYVLPGSAVLVLAAVYRGRMVRLWAERGRDFEHVCVYVCGGYIS